MKDLIKEEVLQAELDKRYPLIGDIDHRSEILDKRSAFLDGVLWQIDRAIEHFKQ